MPFTFFDATLKLVLRALRPSGHLKKRPSTTLTPFVDDGRHVRQRQRFSGSRGLMAHDGVHSNNGPFVLDVHLRELVRFRQR